MKRVVVIGGGTGNYTVLSGLKTHRIDLTAIVSMADDGGSTGILRDELGVLPPGDVRQCLVALSHSSETLRSLMNYRFENGGLGGHSFGNILLSALEKVTGSFESAVDEMGKILFIRGHVIPVTTHQTRLKMVLKSGKVLEGEKEVYLSTEIDKGYEKIYLDPEPKVNPKAIEAIYRADLLVIGPGGLHTSIIPNLLVEGISAAICASNAKKVYVANLMNRKGQTTGYSVGDYLRVLVKYLGIDPFDTILVNSQAPPPDLIDLYASEGELVLNDLKDDPRVVTAPFLGKVGESKKGDTLIKRSLIRHDQHRLSEELVHLVNHL